MNYKLYLFLAVVAGGVTGWFLTEAWRGNVHPYILTASITVMITSNYMYIRGVNEKYS